MSVSGEAGAARLVEEEIGGKRYRVLRPTPASRKAPNTVKGHVEAIMAAIRRALKPSMTLMIPDVEELYPEKYRGVILLNYDKCIGCSLCARVCPARAIKMYKVPGDKRIRPGYDMGRCIFCGYCVDICPVEALSHAWIHDLAYEDIGSMVFDPIDWAKFSKKILDEQEERLKKRKMVVTIVDEEVGLRYEPVRA